jgi:hypothetical protein
MAGSVLLRPRRVAAVDGFRSDTRDALRSNVFPGSTRGPCERYRRCAPWAEKPSPQDGAPSREISWLPSGATIDDFRFAAAGAGVC